MAIWNILLYLFGAMLALRSLLSLMAQHKRHLEQTLYLQALHAKPRKTDPAESEGRSAAA